MFNDLYNALDRKYLVKPKYVAFSGDFFALVNGSVEPTDRSTFNVKYANALIGSIGKLVEFLASTLNPLYTGGILSTDIYTELLSIIKPSIAVSDNASNMLPTSLKTEIVRLFSYQRNMSRVDFFFALYLHILRKFYENFPALKNKIKIFIEAKYSDRNFLWFKGGSSPDIANNTYIHNGFFFQEQMCYYLNNSELIYVSKIDSANNKISYYKYPYVKEQTGSLSSITILASEGSKKYLTARSNFLSSEGGLGKLLKAIKDNSEGVKTQTIYDFDRDMTYYTFICVPKDPRVKVDDLWYDAEEYGNVSIYNLDNVRQVITIDSNLAQVNTVKFKSKFVILDQMKTFKSDGSHNLFTILLENSQYKDSLIEKYNKVYADNVSNTVTSNTVTSNTIIIKSDSIGVKKIAEQVNLLLNTEFGKKFDSILDQFVLEPLKTCNSTEEVYAITQSIKTLNIENLAKIVLIIDKGILQGKIAEKMNKLAYKDLIVLGNAITPIVKKFEKFYKAIKDFNDSHRILKFNLDLTIQ